MSAPAWADCSIFRNHSAGVTAFAGIPALLRRTSRICSHDTEVCLLQT